MNVPKTVTLALVLVAALTASLLASGTLPAQVYGGAGLSGGMNAAGTIGGLSTLDGRAFIIRLIEIALDYVLIIAVAAVIVAGIYLIVSNGDEGQKDKAKNIIIYVSVGIVLILFARVIVVFVNNLGS